MGLWGLPGAVLGHTYPFSRFRGGKGVATAMGGLLGVMAGCLIIGLVTWAIIFSQQGMLLCIVGFGISLPVCALVNYWTTDLPGGAGKVVWLWL